MARGRAAPPDRQGDDLIQIAIPVENGVPFGHFGHAPRFALVHADAETGAIIAREDLQAPPHAPGVLPNWLAEKGVNLVMTSGMGLAAGNLLAKCGIAALTGIAGDSPEALAAAHFAGPLECGDTACDHDGAHGPATGITTTITEPSDGLN